MEECKPERHSAVMQMHVTSRFRNSSCSESCNSAFTISALYVAYNVNNTLLATILYFSFARMNRVHSK